MKKYLIWFTIILLIVLGSFVYWKYFFTYSEGYQAGLLQKFSKRGLVFKTNEGEMILSSVRSGAEITLASEKFFFSVTDQDVAAQLDRLQGEFVVVHYKQRNGAVPWVGETKFIVDSVRVSDHNPYDNVRRQQAFPIEQY